MSATESTISMPIYQVKWFSKKKGFGFVNNTDGEDMFVHHSDIMVDGFRYLKEGEYVTGSMETMDDGKRKIANIHAPMTGGLLMCQVESSARHQRSVVGTENNGGDAMHE
jgi:CspA family cold shock protein